MRCLLFASSFVCCLYFLFVVLLLLACIVSYALSCFSAELWVGFRFCLDSGSRAMCTRGFTRSGGPAPQTLQVKFISIHYRPSAIIIDHRRSSEIILHHQCTSWIISTHHGSLLLSLIITTQHGSLHALVFY